MVEALTAVGAHMSVGTYLAITTAEQERSAPLSRSPFLKPHIYVKCTRRIRMPGISLDSLVVSGA